MGVVTGESMAQMLDSRETVTFRELIISEIIQTEALIALLDRKGVISKQELLQEIRAVNASMQTAAK
jgi:hypothetical protein